MAVGPTAKQLLPGLSPLSKKFLFIKGGRGGGTMGQQAKIEDFQEENTLIFCLKNTPNGSNSRLFDLLNDFFLLKCFFCNNFRGVEQGFSSWQINRE